MKKLILEFQLKIDQEIHFIKSLKITWSSLPVRHPHRVEVIATLLALASSKRSNAISASSFL